MDSTGTPCVIEFLSQNLSSPAPIGGFPLFVQTQMPDLGSILQTEF